MLNRPYYHLPFDKTRKQHYKLEGENVVPCTYLEWVAWSNRKPKEVASFSLADSEVKTVFIGVGEILFITSVVQKKGISSSHPLRTWREALSFHNGLARAIVNNFNKKQPNPTSPPSAIIRPR